MRSPDLKAGESLAERIETIQRGLMPEDEFAATVSWLGNSAGIYHIDQTPMPLLAPTEEVRPPDFSAFPVIAGKPIPVLIEVKSQQEKRLHWSERYLTSLRKFAECVGLPFASLPTVTRPKARLATGLPATALAGLGFHQLDSFERFHPLTGIPLSQALLGAMIYLSFRMTANFSAKTEKVQRKNLSPTP